MQLHVQLKQASYVAIVESLGEDSYIAVIYVAKTMHTQETCMLMLQLTYS